MSRAPAAVRSAPQPRRRRSNRVLWVIAGLLFASGLVRIADGSGLAIARELGALVGSATASSPKREVDLDGVEALLAALREREARLGEAEARLAERERAVVLAEEEVKAGLARMAEAEASLRGLLTIADTAAEEDLARLTSMYEAMKPAEAAALFGEMEPGFAAGFLGRMRADAAAAVLSGLPPDKAYALSVVLAGRNASVKRD